MPLTAILKETGDRISILDFESPRHQLKGKLLVCPFCQCRLVIVQPAHKINHFRHYESVCKSPVDDIEYDNESIDHVFCKIQLFKMLKETYKDSRVELEYSLPKVNRRADIMMIGPQGDMKAYEIQLCNVPIENLEERTLDYESLDCDVVWFFGGKALNPEKESWARKRFGVVHRIYIETQSKPTVKTRL